MRRLLALSVFLFLAIPVFAQEKFGPPPSGGKIQNNTNKTGPTTPPSGFGVPQQTAVKQSEVAVEDSGRDKLPIGPTAFALIATIGLLVLVNYPYSREE